MITITTDASVISAALISALFVSLNSGHTHAWQQSQWPAQCFGRRPLSGVLRHRQGRPLFSDWKDNSEDPNTWGAASDEPIQSQPDWRDTLSKKEDGTFWSTFEPIAEDTTVDTTVGAADSDKVDEEIATQAWLNTLANLSAEEVEFNLKEADRADKARQMQEWGFTSETITNTLGVATDTTLEKDEVAGMQIYREEAYLDEIDMETVESHTMVEKDEETGDPVRTQMVYVDEHTCIGCTNCAMIAQSTFFMQSEHGRARVFQQWGDDDETIQIAIETCPVDCIHYVPYDELVHLEKDRRGQNINFKARLVSQGEYGGSASNLSGGGANRFTAPQKISGNMGSRCSNCPSRGCKDCPMYGVGRNPAFEKKEKARKERIARKRLQQQREAEQKSADL